MKTSLKRGGMALGSIGAMALVYQLLLRRPILKWGATDAEAHARLPGDELLDLGRLRAAAARSGVLLAADTDDRFVQAFACAGGRVVGRLRLPVGHAALECAPLIEGSRRDPTRAITINAPAAAIWPWIAQMGPAPRGGAYTYDWIENLLRLDMHSVDRVLPEYQHPKVGDTLGYGEEPHATERVDPQQVLATRSQDGNWVWSFILREQDGNTR